MVKKIFIWFFCNLYYFYARKKSRDADIVIINSIGVLMAFPVIFFVGSIVWALNNFQLGKGLAILTIIMVMVPFLILFNWLFYKNKRYLRLLENFSEENYNRYIFFYTIILFLILPGGMMIAIMKSFS